MDNLALGTVSDKDVVAQLISSKKPLTKPNKAMTAQFLTQDTTISKPN